MPRMIAASKPETGRNDRMEKSMMLMMVVMTV